MTAAPVRRLGLPAIALLVALALLSGLWGKGFWGAHGESRRAEAARETLEDGHWLVPTLQGEPFITKPPLLYWASAASMGLFGVSEGAARLPAALAALLAVLAVGGLARRHARDLGQDADEARRAAQRAAAAAASLPLLLGMGLNAETEALLLACTALALFAYLGLPPGGRASDGLPARAGLALALAAGFLVKGPLGWLFPLFGILAHEALAPAGRRRLRWSDLGLFLAAHALFVLPWFLLVLRRVPDALSTWMGESVARIADEEFAVHREPAWYYLPQLVALAPWVLLLLPPPPPEGTASRLRFWPLLWMALGVGFLSLAASKRAHYLLSLAPAVALCAVWRPGGRWGRVSDGLLRGLGLALPVLLALALLWLEVQQRARGGWRTALAVAGALALGGWLMRARRAWETPALLAISFTLTLALAGQGLLPAIDAYRSPADFAAEALAALPADAEVANWKNDNYAIGFYLHRTVRRTWTESELRERLPEGGWVVCTREHAPSLLALPGAAELALEHVAGDPFRPGKERVWQLWRWSPAAEENR